MEKKNKTEYNTEYVRQKRGSIRRQERGTTLEGTERLEIRIKSTDKEKLKEIANNREIGVNQLLREIIEKYIHSN